jgi:iron-sulfur cluster repair protein YtfE (RIC family)
MREYHGGGIGRTLTFVGGVTAGLIAGRVLPPFVAMAYGALRSAAGEDPFNGLVLDHRRFIALLGRMEAQRDAGILQRSQLLFRLKRSLAAHAMAEEDVVYPLLKEEAEAAGDARKLYAEHGQIKVLLFQLERQLREGAAWGGELRRLTDLIDRHARHEEEVEFPRLRQALSAAQHAALSRDIEREKSLIL